METLTKVFTEFKGFWIVMVLTFIVGLFFLTIGFNIRRSSKVGAIVLGFTGVFLVLGSLFAMIGLISLAFP